MTEKEKWQFILDLDEELLKGCVIISEWSTFLIKDADIAFVHGAHLASILAAMAGIESHLRYESTPGERQGRLLDLIDNSLLDEELRQELHALRRYRNQWVHVHDPHSDESLLDKPEEYEAELATMARRAIRSLRQVIYARPFV